MKNTAKRILCFVLLRYHGNRRGNLANLHFDTLLTGRNVATQMHITPLNSTKP